MGSDKNLFLFNSQKDTSWVLMKLLLQNNFRIIQYHGNDSVKGNRGNKEILVDRVILNNIPELENNLHGTRELEFRYNSEHKNAAEKIITHKTKHTQELLASNKEAEAIENGANSTQTKFHTQKSPEKGIREIDPEKTSKCTTYVLRDGSTVTIESNERKESHSGSRRDKDVFRQFCLETPSLSPLESKISLERKLFYVEGLKETAETYSYPLPLSPRLQASNLLSPINNTTSKIWDDSEGYYRVKIGEMLNLRYEVFENIGQGVYSNVVRAKDKMHDDTLVAIKILRNDDIVHISGLNELKTLKELNKADPDDKYHCIRLLSHFYHGQHLCLVFESFSMNIRQVLHKYGKNHGISIQAVQSYTQQILLALKLLYKNKILHADLKPDNILVNESKVLLKLCDFGSAIKVSETKVTPYLASRFYRAPEVILGHPHDYGVDIWATACTIYEMATGRIMFDGNTNNEMLKLHMDLKGKVPIKMIKKSKFRKQHFDSSYNFLQREIDCITEKETVVLMSSIKPSRDLQSELEPPYLTLSIHESEKLSQLRDLLEKMLKLDPSLRCIVTQCLKHPFVNEKL